MSRVKSNLPALKNRILSFESEVLKIVERIVDRVSLEAAIDMTRVIETSGTGWVGKGARATPEGRIDTGEMIDAVDVDMVVRPRNVIGKVGWGLNGKPAEDYFLAQEEGFINPWTGNFVPPMNVLWAAGVTLKDMATYELRKEF